MAIQSDETCKENRPSISESLTSPLSNSVSSITSQSSCTDEDRSVNSKCTSDIETMSLSSSPFSHQSDTTSPHASVYANAAEVSADYSHSATDEMPPASSLPFPYHDSVLLQDGLSTSASLLDFARSSLMHAHSDYNSLDLTDTTMCGSDTTVNDSPIVGWWTRFYCTDRCHHLVAKWRLRCSAHHFINQWQCSTYSFTSTSDLSFHHPPSFPSQCLQPF